MKYKDFKILFLNELISQLSFEEDFENIYNSFNYGYTDLMIESYIKRTINEVLNKNSNAVKNQTIEFNNLSEIRDKKTPYRKQVGGEHYISEVQPVQFIKANNLNFNQGNIVKYISRYQKKNGLKDLKKVVQYTLFEAFEEYPEEYVSFTETIKELID